MNICGKYQSILPCSEVTVWKKSWCSLRKANFEPGSWPNHARYGHGKNTYLMRCNEFCQHPPSPHLIFQILLSHIQISNLCEGRAKVAREIESVKSLSVRWAYRFDSLLNLVHVRELAKSLDLLCHPLGRVRLKEAQRFRVLQVRRLSDFHSVLSVEKLNQVQKKRAYEHAYTQADWSWRWTKFDHSTPFEHGLSDLRWLEAS